MKMWTGTFLFYCFYQHQRTVSTPRFQCVVNGRCARITFVFSDFRISLCFFFRYVKTYLLPDRGKMGKKKTLVVKKTLNPVYNEILRVFLNSVHRQSFCGDLGMEIAMSVWMVPVLNMAAPQPQPPLSMFQSQCVPF